MGWSFWLGVGVVTPGTCNDVPSAAGVACVCVCALVCVCLRVGEFVV